MIYIDATYAINAAELLRYYGFNILNLQRLWAEIYSNVEPKKIFFNTLNFQLDGELRQTYWFDAVWHNSLFYSLLSNEQNSIKKP